ncbi:MAG TPA: hypothetical protein VGV39_03480 [Mesorhizobium sp.]|uniref:hypothetical protein n=1 Tax=Mesorhizobium sp. TaxID=1871066 RepID=UPI002DDCBCD6|nr:hypothetical protein [Mesorhizobium sp.]HEV2502106.1 hypothetical protein [Mesorhizobium sp.]
MFSMKENHFGHEAKTERSIVKFFDPWERKLAFDTDHNDRMAPSISSENQERVDVDER